MAKYPCGVKGASEELRQAIGWFRAIRCHGFISFGRHGIKAGKGAAESSRRGGRFIGIANFSWSELTELQRPSSSGRRGRSAAGPGIGRGWGSTGSSGDIARPRRIDEADRKMPLFELGWAIGVEELASAGIRSDGVEGLLLRVRTKNQRRPMLMGRGVRPMCPAIMVTAGHELKGRHRPCGEIGSG